MSTSTRCVAFPFTFSTAHRVLPDLLHSADSPRPRFDVSCERGKMSPLGQRRGAPRGRGPRRRRGGDGGVQARAPGRRRGGDRG